MLTNLRGLGPTTESDAAVAHYDEAVENYFQYRLQDRQVREVGARGGWLKLARSLLSERTWAKPNSAGTWAKYASVLDALGGA